MALEENPNKDMPSQFILKDLDAYHIAKHYIKHTTIEIRTNLIDQEKREYNKQWCVKKDGHKTKHTKAK